MTKKRNQNNKPEVLEGEIFEGQIGFNIQQRNLNWRNPDYWLLILSFVPILGMILSITAIYVGRSKNRLVLIPSLAFVISLFSTTTFLVLWLIFGAIF